jgi:hypothetical protein
MLLEYIMLSVDELEHQNYPEITCKIFYSEFPDIQ